MKFKKWRYNLIALGLVAIIGCYVGFVVLPDDGAIDSNIAVEDPENPGNNLPVDDSDDDYVDDDMGFEEMNAIDLVNYSLNNLYYGEGFSANYSQNVLTITPVAGAEISATQYCQGTMKRTKDGSGYTSLEEFYYYYNNVPSVAEDQMSKDYEFGYVKDGKLTKGSTSVNDRTSKTYDLSKGKVETMSLSDGYAKYKTFFANELNIAQGATEKAVIPKSACQSIKAGKTDTKTNTKEITIVLKTDKLTTDLKEAFGSTGQMLNIGYGTLKMTFTVNIKTGKMKKMIMDENLQADCTVSIAGRLTVTGKTTFTFTEVNKLQTIECPK